MEAVAYKSNINKPLQIRIKEKMHPLCPHNSKYLNRIRINAWWLQAAETSI